MHQVTTFCYIRTSIEKKFAENLYKVVILVDLDVRAELVIVTNKFKFINFAII